MASKTPIASVETTPLSAEDQPDRIGAPLPSIAFNDHSASDDSVRFDAPHAHWDDEPEAIALTASTRDIVVRALCGVALAGWTALFAVAHMDQFAAADPARWSGWIVEWCAPAALIALFYLIAMRSSRREAGRFLDAASALRAESSALESSLVSVNREISLAREFLASQTRDLDSIGRVAVDRISQNADRLSQLVRDNAEKVETLGSVSTVALGNMEQLRDHLPVINNSAKDVASNIGNVGRVAMAHLQDMVKGLNRLNDFGQASERQVMSIRDRIDDSLGSLEARTQQLDTVITGRFDALEERSAGFSIDLERHESEARESLRQRAAAMAEELASTRHRLDENEAEALTSLRARLSALRDEAGTLGRSLRDGETAAVEQWNASIARLSNDMARFDADMAERHKTALAQAVDLGVMTENTTKRLVQAEARIEALTLADTSVAAAMETRLDALERRLSDTGDAIEKLTDSSVRLLELVQASASHCRDQLPMALQSGEEALAAHEARVLAVTQLVHAAKADGAALADQVGRARDGLRDAGGEMTALQATLADHLESQQAALANLRERLAELEADTGHFALQAREELDSALIALSDSARLVINSIENDGAVQVNALADKLAESSGAALEHIMRLKASEIAGRLEQAAAHAAGVSSEAADQLRQRLATVEELTQNLEARIEVAREAAEDRIDHDFTRRMASIADTLQSVAVDIAGALDADVADTAWAAYLKGDRGIFARRAVRLLSNVDAKTVLHLYETDVVFQSQVNRYIHDFEAMLRQLLATRDGHAVSVTLLSSDMGKVYVALAQAIERLRN